MDDWFKWSGKVWEEAHVQLQQATNRQKKFADRRRRPTKSFQIGVWLSTRDIKLRLPSRKLSPRYIGPFKIIKRINSVSYRLLLPPRYRIWPTFHVSLLKPVHYSPIHPLTESRDVPTQMEVDGEPAYSVRTLLDSRRHGKRMEYLVDWEGYGPEEQSWVAAHDIFDPTLIANFHHDHPDRPALRCQGRPSKSSSGASRGEGGTVTRRPGAGQSVRPQQPRPLPTCSPEF